jgi:hypothetical protein
VIATNADAIATAADAIATAADVVQTGLDVVATSADVVQTGLDVTAAAGSASAASGSASAAAGSAAAAAASYDAFDDRYLGDKASDPTLDNDGNALLTGALYFNTTSDVMKVYDGSAWNIAAISSASPTFTGTVTADGLSLGDNEKATFGNSNDLEIYHNGSNSYVQDTGTGKLHITSNGTGVSIDKGTSELMATFDIDGAVTLYHDSAAKLATTSTGIDVTGTATMDGLTVSTDSYRQLLLTFPDSFTSKLQLGFSNFYLQGSGTTDELTIANNSSGQTKFINQSKTSMLIDNSGDISFYEDTGTTPKFFWDASEERLGVGTVSPARTLHLAANTNCEIRLEAVGQRHYAIASNSSNAFVVNDVTAGAERLRIDSSGNVLLNATNSFIGTNTTDESDNKQLILSGGGAASVLRGAYISLKGNEFATDSGSISYVTGKGSSDHIWFDGNSVTERMRLTSSGDIRLTRAAPNVEDNISTINFYNSSSGINLASITGKRTAGGTNYGSLTFNTTSSGSIAERMRIDSSGNLLVGKTASNFGTAGVQLQSNGELYVTRSGGGPVSLNRLSSDGGILFFAKDGTTVGSIGSNTSGTRLHIGKDNVALSFAAGGANAIIPWDSTANAVEDAALNLGGSTARFKDLYLSGDIVINDQTNGATRKILFDMRNTGGAQSDFSLQANNGNFLFYSEAAATERARIDSSGNLLVGTTSTDLVANNGIVATAAGYLDVGRDALVARFTRRSTDGSIVEFRKDGTTVGSIGVWNNDNISLYGNSSHAGIGMATNSVEPIRNNAPADNSVDLGVVSARFKDLYLGGGVYLGGTDLAGFLLLKMPITQTT